MSRITGTGISLSSSYYIRNFYTSNRDAGTASKRKELSAGMLSKADCDALHRAVKKLRGFSFADDTTDDANIHAGVTAFVEIYNNTLSSSDASADASLARYAKYLKNLSGEHEKDLKKIGITINADGSLKANENLLKAADVADIKKLFSREADYGAKVSRHTRRMTEKAENLLYAEQTGAGYHVNISI